MEVQITVADVQGLDWFSELKQLIDADIAKDREAGADLRPSLLIRIREARSKMEGWMRSLSNPDLDSEVRRLIEKQMGDENVRLAGFESDLHGLDHRSECAAVDVDPREIVDRLNGLAAILGGDNTTRTNVELARYIESIRCYPEGRVVLRMCKFGAIDLEGMEQAVLPVTVPDAVPTGVGGKRLPRPRRLSARQLTSEDAGPELRDISDWGTDLHRFAGFHPGWFWVDEFSIPEPTCWAKENASEVTRARRLGATHEQLAVQFGVSVPTIRKALKLGAAADPNAPLAPRKMPRARWQDSHYPEVMAMQKAGRLVREIAAHFGKSEPLVTAALKIGKAEEQR